MIASLLFDACGLLEVQPDRSGLIQVPWALAGAAPHRLDLVVTTGGNDCGRYLGVDVVETPGNVELRAWVEPIRRNSCYLARFFHRTAVTLTLPLGARTLSGCILEAHWPQGERESCGEVLHGI